MSLTVKQFYCHLRHDIRVNLNFARSYLILRNLRARLKRKCPERRFVAVMLLEHLGDIVACEPVVRYLKEKYPKAYIVWGVKKAYRELIDSNPEVDLTLSIHCLTERMLLIKTQIFDEVVDLHFPDRYCSLCRKPLMKADDKRPVNLRNYFDFGGILPALALSAHLPTTFNEQPRIYIPVVAVQRVTGLHLPDHFIAVNCSSNNIEKDWPAEKWLELVEKIVDRYGMHVVEVGLMPSLSESRNAKYVNLCGKLSILESAEVIRRANLFIGIDSGPAHLANAVGTYGIILMGSYLRFEKYNPFSGGYWTGENAEIIRQSGSVADIAVDRVFKIVEKSSDRIGASVSHVV